MKGQTCYICTQALHWKTKEGLVRGCACRGTAGFAHVSCLAEQAKILFAEAEENNLGWEAQNLRWIRWSACSLCEQDYHGVVFCALGWACWKTYLGRPETDQVQWMAMTVLGNSLSSARCDEDALAVREAELSLQRRVGASEISNLVSQSNLAATYQRLGRLEKASSMQRDVYSGYLKIMGEEHSQTLSAANNYANSLVGLDHFEEAKALLRKVTLVARRALGEGNSTTLRLRWIYAQSLYRNPGATLDDLREAVTTLEDAARIARRVLGGAHPTMGGIETSLRKARAVLRFREGGDVESTREAVEAMTAGDA